MIDYIDLPANNVFQNGSIVSIEGIDTLQRQTLNILPSEKDRWHIIESEDMLDELAHRYYEGQNGDASKYWWILADANQIPNPLDISYLVGSMLLIPELTRVKRMIDTGINDGESDVSETLDYFQLVANPPIPLNPPNIPDTDDTTGDTDNGTSLPQYLVLRQPNGGFTLVTADNNGQPLYQDIDPATLSNPQIFEHL